jgi:hypothetical protein
MKPVRFSPISILMIYLTVTGLSGLSGLGQPTVKLKPETIRAFDAYQEALLKEFLSDIESKNYPKLILNNRVARVSARNGEILINKGSNTPDISGGIIHDWIGGMFIPDVKVKDVTAVLIDYNKHQDYYPEVVRSRVISQQENKIRGYHRLKKEKVLTVILDTEHEITVYPEEDEHQYLLSFSKRIQEVKNPDTASEKLLPVGEDSGFLWRLNAAWTLEQEEDGVMVECATSSLSRDIPWGLGWMIRPFVESTPREALEGTLQATRMAVKASVR